MEIVIQRRAVRLPVLPIITAILVVAMILFTMRIGQVQGNQIGVLINNLTGNIDVRSQAGTVFYNGLLTDFYLLDNTTQTIRMVDKQRVNIKSAQGADVRMDVEINYRLVQDPSVIAKTIVPECGLDQVAIIRRIDESWVRDRQDAYKTKWVRDYARAIVRYVFGDLDNRDFYNAALRDKKARESETQLNAVLRSHGIEVLKVVPDKFDFYPEYEKLIADKKSAEQEVQSQEQRANALLEEQKKKRTETQARINVELAQLDGELKRAVLNMKGIAERETKAAEAYAYQAQKLADAEFYRSKNEAQSILALATAEADGLRALANSLSGDGADNVLRRAYANALSGMRISGVPYATDPRIQKVEVRDADAESSASSSRNRAAGAANSGTDSTEKGENR